MVAPRSVAGLKIWRETREGGEREASDQICSAVSFSSHIRVAPPPLCHFTSLSFSILSLCHNVNFLPVIFVVQCSFKPKMTWSFILRHSFNDNFTAI